MKIEECCLGRVDFEILRRMTQRKQITLDELLDGVNPSMTWVWTRVEELKDSGYISYMENTREYELTDRARRILWNESGQPLFWTK